MRTRQKPGLDQRLEAYFEARSGEWQVPLANAVRLALAGQDPPAGLFNPAGAKSASVNPAQAPSITPGGIVPLYGTVNTIQPEERRRRAGLRRIVEQLVFIRSI